LSNCVAVDIRVVLLWDTDMTDVELEVTYVESISLVRMNLTCREPGGEKCFSFHNKTQHGGMVSRNFTKGYGMIVSCIVLSFLIKGPQEYLIKSATPGQYDIAVKLFTSLSKFTGIFLFFCAFSFCRHDDFD
jgi:hypothetical protein